ncbi:hypothetical protein HK103_003150 [Boothiomyces macroporosus]|uniref:Thaumatin-like protein n=1 Tax=Boothiomyces macroporosus TaxID=261099 RepID=A0AAD5UM06_9FUNG|nr:hypothetical protein HK103_003150 [Boothiomyces macroporosus]
MIHLLLSATTALVPRANSAGRNVKVVNNCAAPVNINFIPGAIGFKAGLNQCNSDADCLDGGSCNTKNKVCFYIAPKLSGPTLLQPGQTNTLTFPFFNNNGPVWSGNIEGCTGETCDATGLNRGPQTAKAEFTLARTDVDFYDVSLIDGFSIPMEMSANVPDSLLKPSDPYFCTNPGSQTPKHPDLGACSWSLEPPTPFQVWVSGDNKSPKCAKDSDCQSGLKCGIPSQTPGFDPSNDLHCGKLLGYFSPEKACGADKCSTTLAAPNNGVKLFDLFGCSNGLPSCYQDKSKTNEGCCGCQNWNSIGIKVPAVTQDCTFINPNWINLVLPQLQWLKQTCPTAYVYPFDDKSSTFVCGDFKEAVDPFHPQQKTNTVEYTVTFCPGNSKIVQ